MASPRVIAFVDCSSSLKPEAFQRCFQNWIANALTTDDTKLPIDSSPLTARRAAAPHDAAHSLSRLPASSPPGPAEEGYIALGQVATEAKSNEITAIPQLL